MESPNDGIPSVVEAAVVWMVLCTHFTARIRYCLLFPSLHFNSEMCKTLHVTVIRLALREASKWHRTCFKYEVIVIQSNARVVRIVPQH